VSYVNCPRCRLTVRVRADDLAPEHCPRCAARHGVHERVFMSPQPSRLLNVPFAGTGPGPGAPLAAPPAGRAPVG